MTAYGALFLGALLALIVLYIVLKGGEDWMQFEADLEEMERRAALNAALARHPAGGKR